MTVEYFLDPKCYELAEYFLPKAPNEDVKEIKELAKEIQETIQSFLDIRNERNKAIAGEGDKK